MFEPRAYQTSIIDHIINTPRCAVWAGMGMGKTAATLTALDQIERTEHGPTLVVAPLRVALSTWPDEAKKWPHLRAIKVQPIIGTPKQRQSALQTVANVYTTNYENIPWLVEHFGDKWPFTKVVADESTRLKSYRTRQGGRRARALGLVAHRNVTRFIELTGTPSPNGLQDLWGQAWFLDKGARLGKTFWAFQARWFQSIRVGHDPNAVRLDPWPWAQEQIEGGLRDLCISLDARDHFDITQPIVNNIRIELPPKARSLYGEMERQMFLSLECGKEIEAANAAAKTIKCLQLANGAIYTDDKCNDFVEIHDAKLQALEGVIEEAAGMPVLVAYHFKSDLARLMRTFPKAVALDKNPQTIRDWNAGKIPILLAHPASAGHGLNLQDGGNILAFFGHWWNLEQYQQIIERIGPTRQAQAGHNRPVFIHHIVAANTVDELVMQRRESKKSTQDILLAAMKSRNKGGRCE